MRNKVKRTLSFLLTFVMLCSLLPAMALAKEPEGRYETVAGVGALVEDATVEVFTTKDAGTIELTGINSVETTFTQGIGYREYTATANEGWVFDTWVYEQWYEGEDLGNRTDNGWGKRYSFTNTGDDWHDPYTKGNATISVNRLLTTGETKWNPLSYKVYADFNPTITATAGENGTISDAGKQVEVTYGEDQAFDITADEGYVIDTIKVDGEDVEEGKNEEFYTYTFENVIAPHTIDVTFKVKPQPGQCTVTYVVEGDIPADYQAPEADIVNEGETYTVKSVPEPVVDYTFSGWYDENQNIVTEFKVTGDVTLTGVWTYTGEKDVWDTVYGSIRVYMDEGTEADFNNLPGLNIHKQVRIYSDKYPEPNYRLTVPVANYWGTTNIAEHVTARDISEIVLAKDKLVGSSEKINIPMTGNDDYQVTVSEGEDKFGLVPYTYLKIEITKKEPVEETVTLTYDANGGKGAPESVEVNKNTEYTLDSTTVPTHDAVQGLNVSFQGWSTDPEVMGRIYSSDQVPAVQSTVPVQDKDVTVYAVWAFDASQVPDVYPVQVVVYQNGDTETPVVTETVDYLRKGDTFNLAELNIQDYYSSDYGFETTGWFNDGKWNEYKAGQNPEPLQGEITINGWTNVICMVTDWEPVHVYAVTDGDKENKVEIYSGTALKGTALIDFLDQNVTVPEKEGYTVDKWYNWDWYGNKYAEDTKVNGWTNAYVTYTSNDTDRTVEVTFTVNSEYGAFTDYGKGPVTFKGLPENSTEQYPVPAVTANPGYKFVGWKGQGADVIEWGADASTFGVPGLCYFPEGSDVGYASIEAVFEEVPVSGKTVEVTFTVNPAYGTFTEYGEGPVTFKNIDAESTQQFEVPKVTANAGYKFVGWKGQGADVIEWGADASTFGVPGLCYFPEGSDVGYASIEAVFEEVPVSGKTVEVTFTVNPAYGTFTEYGEGPVTFKNIDAESTQQFEVPKVTANAGYKFVGWKGQGADVIEWGADASTFGVPGLCYFPEGSDVGYASIEAVFEEVPVSGKTVEVTFTVNPAYGTFTEYGEGPVTFKNIDAESTQQFEVPKVTANAGYKFVGWKGQGADVIEWGADASTFGVPGLCYFPEGSDVGYASIEAVFEEVPVSGKTVEVTFTVNPAYGTFTEYGEGPVTFKNIDAESTQQFEVPKVTANAGYKFVGWKGQGADVIEWGADASTFGVPGLCYFPEGSDVGYASIEAVFEEVPVSGKTVEVTFTVNPAYGTFTEYGEGPVTFKNIDAESTQQFEVPKVTAKDGYKFVGWKGQGADVIEWDADASTFGVPGLCYFPEGSDVGYASIAAVFEKEGGGHTNDYYVTVIVDGKGKVKAEDYGTVDSNETEVIIIPDFESSVKFTMEPADGWKIDDVLVDGESVGDVDSYVLKDDVMLDSPILKVVFEKKSGGSSGGGGSHDKDDDKDTDKTPAKTPDALNGEDHFDYIVGDADGRVHPERNITRAEVASIFFRLLKDDVRSENLTDQNTFTDVSADAWYNVAVSTMSDMGIVFGRTDYQFDPDAYITRAEFAAIAARFDSGSYSGDDLFTDIEGHWAADQINRAAEKGWITGYPDGTFGPNRYITRAEAVTMINRVLNRMPEDEDALHEDMKVFVDNADTNAWYYLAIQEATNSHEYEKDDDGVYETWTEVLPARDWAQYLKLN